MVGAAAAGTGRRGHLSIMRVGSPRRKPAGVRPGAGPAVRPAAPRDTRPSGHPPLRTLAPQDTRDGAAVHVSQAAGETAR
ncbi:hypothetical protein GCM10010517_51980 [Streptosporangium fragile]|uniref:Uncharacterized protein n=1 Tax=Streptosporangium fragile TaxID=46186 RepID=A0ABN3W590_9ACTN